METDFQAITEVEELLATEQQPKLENTRHISFVVDANGKILDFNEANELFGYKSPQQLSQFMLGADWKKLKNGIHQSKFGSCSLEITANHKNGEKRFVRLWGIQLPQESEWPKYLLFAFNTNMNEQMKLEIEKYRHAIDQLEVCIFTTDSSGILLEVNENFLNKYQYTREEIIGKSLVNLLAESKKKEHTNYKMVEFFQSNKRNHAENTIWRGELFEKDKFGNCFWVDKTITPFSNSRLDQSTHYMGISFDVTKKKAIESKIRENDLIQRSLKMKDEFLASMSHEIRTPLNVILGYSDLMLESDLTAEQYKHATTIKKSGQLLLSLINDILDLSKLESGKLTLDNRPFRIRELFGSVKEMMALEAVRKDLHFTFNISPDVPDIILGDETRIEQIAVNLINNAIKFTKIGFVNVILDVDNKNLIIKVKDSGIGIPQDKLETIFESFTQSTKYITREFGGSGLGLTIVKKLLNHLNGSIHVDSQVNEGSVFTVKLPLITPKDELSGSRDYGRNYLNSKQEKVKLDVDVLLVEDNEYNQGLARARMGAWGCNLHVVGNGLEALESLRRQDYDLILMDIQMPLMDGYEATKRIRTEFAEYKSEIPIIALTAHASNSSAQEAVKVGFSDYMFKPFNTDELYFNLKKYGAVGRELRTAHQKQSSNGNSDIDFSFVESEALGHGNIIKMLIESMVKEFHLFIREAKRCCEEEDWNGVYKAVHRVGPGISNFDIKGVMKHIKQLYQKSKAEEETNTYLFLIQNAENEFKKVEPLIQQKLKSLEL